MSDILEISEKEFQPLYNQLEREIQQLYQINIQAIGAKSNSIQDVGTNVLFYLSLLIVLTLLVNLLLLGFFPSYLANPLIDLNQKITEVAAGNYDQKLEVKYHHADEISDLTRSFNQMSVKLSHYDDTSLSKIWREKRRAEALIYLMKEAIWVLDEHKKILHANKKAQEIVQMTENEMVGMPIYTLANQFEFIKEAIKDWLFATSSEENDYLEETLVVEYKGISETFRKYTLEITIHNEQKNSDILVGFAIVLEKVC
jgi:nitrogen fixation/metabolism regulation signal transduction histidine kinase